MLCLDDDTLDFSLLSGFCNFCCSCLSLAALIASEQRRGIASERRHEIRVKFAVVMSTTPRLILGGKQILQSIRFNWSFALLILPICFLPKMWDYKAKNYT